MMTKKRRQMLGRVALAAAGLGLVAAPASAQQWRVVPHAQVRETYTDNALQTRNDRQGDFITTLNPGLHVEGNGARARLGFDYDVFYDKYIDHDELDGLRHRLLGMGTYDLMPRALTLEARAAASTTDVSRGGRRGFGERTVGGNQTNVVNYSLSPTYTHDFGGTAEAELRYRFSQVLYTEADVGNSRGTPSDATTHFLSAILRNGRQFNQFKWHVNGTQSLTDRSDRGEIRRGTILGTGEYYLNRGFAILARAGYETIDIPGVRRAEYSGPVAAAGIHWIPSPTFDARAEYGYRYGEPFWAADASYSPRGDVTVRLHHGVTVSTEQEQASGALTNVNMDPTGRLIDVTTGLEADPNSSSFGFTDLTFRQEATILSVVASHGRNELTGSLDYVKRTYQGSPSAAGRSESLWGAGAAWRHHLSPRMDLTVAGNYSDVLDGQNVSGGGQVMRARLSLGYDFTRKTRGDATYRYVDVGGDGSRGFRENILSVGLRITF